ncbi:TetR/AcrR family transcriptional regulator [Arthrobacter sp. SLBN-53]|uniref:TetR/AcrR family transcriptional regulator n=1 Tax=Arthrobacter sp. SLBN-53 TaxID=2768412 RepID=UPI00114EA305|nr:TetR/AcrR family transcriptional regulator [Arthrobacter sp. SLBN-53]TQK28502.1 TetR family transcriptional regulator [Arthrobacter sp. SLBN-53]
MASRTGVTRTTASGDWLLGRDRRDEAAERIYTAAAELLSRHGYEHFSVDAVAAAVHCSPATVYRHTGGKAALRDAVLTRHAERILDSVRSAIADLTGPERVVTATLVALRRMRADPLADIMRSMVTVSGDEWITESPVVSRFATEMVGLSTPDPLATQWLIRSFLALWHWPVPDPDAEEEMVRRFLGPGFGAVEDDSP